MRQLSIKISTFLMALLVLLSTFSFTIDTHFCGDTAVDTSYFGKADGCEMDATNTVENCEVISKTSCCSNETAFVASPIFIKEKLQSATQKELQFAAVFFFSYFSSFQEVQLEPIFYKDFSPPDIYQDYQALYQTYLI